MLRNILKIGLVLGFAFGLSGCGFFGCGSESHACGDGQMDHDYK